jgi:predicted transcriptional regulator
MFMQSRGKLCIVIFALFIIGTVVPAYADQGGYVVTFGGPFEPDIHQSEIRQMSFWELPLWVQLFYVSGALGALLVFFKFLPFFLIKSKRLLDNRNREKIYDYIDENPGCTVNDISRSQSMNVGSVRYHVQRLEIMSRIIHMKFGKFTRLFRNSGAYSDREIVVLSALNIRMNKAIVQVVREQPGLSNKQIAEMLEIKESMAHLYLKHLLKDEIVRYEKEGQHKLYYIVSDVEEILKKIARQQPAQKCKAAV